VLFDCKKNAVEISIGTANGPKFVTSGYDEANAREKLAGDAEYIRLMYVAATRAKDQLVISLYRVAKKTDSSFANIIERTCIKTPEIWHRLEFNQNGQGLEEPNAAKVDYLLDTEEDRIKWLEERETLIKLASRPVSLAATTIARINKEEAEGELPYRKGRGEPIWEELFIVFFKLLTSPRVTSWKKPLGLRQRMKVYLNILTMWSNLSEMHLIQKR